MWTDRVRLSDVWVTLEVWLFPFKEKTKCTSKWLKMTEPNLITKVVNWNKPLHTCRYSSTQIYEFEYFSESSHASQQHSKPVPGSRVVCRTNLHTIVLCLKLRGRGISCLFPLFLKLEKKLQAIVFCERSTVFFYHTHTHTFCLLVSRHYFWVQLQNRQPHFCLCWTVIAKTRLTPL